MKKERVRQRVYKTRELARADIFDYIEVFYNRTRRHSHLGGSAPRHLNVPHFEGPRRPRYRGKSTLNAWVIEKWRSKRIKHGVADATLNRDLATLRSALSKAVEWKILAANPIAGVKQRKVDNARVRYLTADEEKRLRDALAKRDKDAIAARKSGNEWRQQRGKELSSPIPLHGFADHLTPMVLLALATGLRRGELTALVWEDVDLANKLLTARAAAAKSNRSRVVPLNREAVLVLERWKRQQGGNGRLFAVQSIKTAWGALMTAASIKALRFHDTRHNFASRLVSNGVDLNTVRELLGHADLKMTLRYAHLAQEHKAKAVETLGRR